MKILLFAFFCGQFLLTSISNRAVAADTKLTQTDAEIRFRQIKQVDYHLYFKLSKSDPKYSGRVAAHVDLNSEAAQVSPSLFLDFDGGEVSSVILNGHAVAYEYDKARILIPTREFHSGANDLTIEFTHEYGHEGAGFHRTLDQADGEAYLYSQFEPYAANKAFPLFDQPDLKATYTLTADVPAHWQVISNMRETSQEALSEHEKRWVFPTSQRFSSYLFALVAGPFVQWESKTTTQQPVSMRLFARGSMKQHLEGDVQRWFHQTNLGFLFYEQAFDYPYPFTKYDQILVPDYNWGAMENVGAVTFSEGYIFRTQPTPLQVLDRAETILHELAHMWFGNLVTMKWWDDLWLNESFATYISNYAMSHFEDQISSARVWQQFNTRAKQWAYGEDDLVTTHPIAGEAADTDEAEANFDGLTYGKGASVLKQLVHLIGEDAFLTGLRGYFKTFAFKNATRTDFLNALSLASGRDLSAWDEEWLRTSGTNSLEVIVEERDGKISRLTLKQGLDESSKRLRTHKTQIALYDRNDQGHLVLRETLNVIYSGSETVVAQAEGKPVPALIYPNDQDHDYVSVVLDARSLALLSDPMTSIQDPLLKQMLTATLFEMVSHSRLTSQEFAKIMFSILDGNQDLAVLKVGLGYLKQVSSHSIARSLKPSFDSQLEAWLENYFDRTAGNDPAKIVLFSSFLSAAKSLKALERIRGWLNQDELAPGFSMDQERRWMVISALARGGLPEAEDLISDELKKDVNDKGKENAMEAHALIPSEAGKKIWWDRLLGKDPGFEKLSVQNARRVMRVFHDLDRPKLTDFSTESYLSVLPALDEDHSHNFTSSFAWHMYPVSCSLEIEEKVTAFLAANPTHEFGAKKEILNKRQINERFRKARALSESAIAQ